MSGPTFVVLLLGTVLLVGALNFLPALTLGPIVEHFLTAAGQTVLRCPCMTYHATRITITIHVSRIMTHKAPSLFDWSIVGPAIGDSFRKLDPRLMVKNPVMFVTMVGAVLTTVGIFTCAPAERSFIGQLALWLWFTVLFANFAEAVAEGRGKAQADSLRKARKDTIARRLRRRAGGKGACAQLQKGDLVVVRGGRPHPGRRRGGRGHRQRG